MVWLRFLWKEMEISKRDKGGVREVEGKSVKGCKMQLRGSEELKAEREKWKRGQCVDLVPGDVREDIAREKMTALRRRRASSFLHYLEGILFL